MGMFEPKGFTIYQFSRYCRAEFPTNDAGHSPPPTNGPTVSPSTYIGRALSHHNDHISNDAVIIYVDAAFSAVRCTYAYVALDATGSYLHARDGQLSASSVLQAELLAILEVLTYLGSCCFTKTKILTDSMLAVTYLHSDKNIWPWDIAFLLQRCLSSWCNKTTSILHTPREMNLLAHTLAQSVDLDSTVTVYHDIPDSLLDFFSI